MGEAGGVTRNGENLPISECTHLQSAKNGANAKPFGPQTAAHAGWWLKGDTAGSAPEVGVIDWRNAEAADYYVNEVLFREHR